MSYVLGARHFTYQLRTHSLPYVRRVCCPFGPWMSHGCGAVGRYAS